VTPELQRLMVEMGSQMPFEAASRLLHELMPTAPARSTLHRHLGRVGQACHQADERQRIWPLPRQAATAISIRSDPQAWLRASIATATGTDGFGPLLRRIARPAGFALN